MPNFRSEEDFRAQQLSEVFSESQNFAKANEGYISKLPQHIKSQMFRASILFRQKENTNKSYLCMTVGLDFLFLPLCSWICHQCRSLFV